MRNFDRSFNRTSRMINIAFIFQLIIIAITISVVVYIAWNMFTNPESVGEFFGRIVKGFNEVKTK